MSVQHKAEETAEGCAEAEMLRSALMIWQTYIRLAKRKFAWEGNK